MELLSDIINNATELIQTGGIVVGFLLIFMESFISILPLGAFVALNTNAFGFLNGLLLSWISTTLGSYTMFLICYYISNKIIYKILKEKTRNKILDKISHFKQIKFTQLVLIITLPFTPSCLINLLAGIVNFPKDKYLITLIIGKALMITFWGCIGMSFIESLTDLKAILFIIIILVFAYFISNYISKKLKIE